MGATPDSPQCPTPHKRVYTHLEAQGAEIFYSQRAYQCPCGLHWHMTSTKTSKRFMKPRHRQKMLRARSGHGASSAKTLRARAD